MEILFCFTGEWSPESNEDWPYDRLTVYATFNESRMRKCTELSWRTTKRMSLGNTRTLVMQKSLILAEKRL